MSDSSLGQVVLVGGGCHDASWLTQAGYEALKQTEVVVYDDLIDSSLLKIPKQATLIYRGKRGHLPSAKQSEIQDLLLELAKKHSHIVRLKGGDPMVFGRALEEIEFLEQHQVPVQIIPGISSFLGILAKEHFGLTKRNQSNAFMVLTATSASQERSQEEWKQLASFSGTLVFLMGMSKIDFICDHLLQGGMNPNTPAAIFTSPAMTLTKTLKAPLIHLAQEAHIHHLQSPGLIVVGGSVESFKPLYPIRIGLTSSPTFNQKLKENFPARFQSVVVLENHYQDFDLNLKEILTSQEKSHSSKGWLVFTSTHGVEHFLNLCQKQHLDLRDLAFWKLATIGPATAKVFQDHGLWPDLVAESNSSSLSEELLKKSAPDERIVLCQSQKALPSLFKALHDKRLVKQVNLYNFSCSSQNEGLVLDYVLFASLEAAKSWPLTRHQDHLVYVCLSHRIAKGLKERFQALNGPIPSIRIASKPNAKALAQVVIEETQEQTSGKR